MNLQWQPLRAFPIALAILLLSPVAAFAAAGPAISTQPQNQNVLTGSNAVFTVVATGQAPLSYQWSFNGTNLSNSAHIGGATTATMTVSNVVGGDGGNYQVVVSNSHGSATSSDATLTVLFPASIVSEPTNQTALFNGSVTLSVQVGGTYPDSFQWYFQGVPLTNGPNVYGVNVPGLTISGVTMANAGNYSVVVSNSYGTAISSNAYLSVVPIVGWGVNDYGQLNIPLSLTNAVAVAAGWFHCLALRADGTVVAWGEDNDNQCDVPPGLSNVVAISAGEFLSTALRSDGTVVSWGWSDGGQTNVPPGLTNAIDISCGALHTIALQNNGSMVQWGEFNGIPMAPPPILPNVVQMGCGQSMTLLLAADGSTLSWGGDTYNPATVFVGISNIVAITPTVALLSDGTATNFAQTNVPPDATNLIAVASGGEHDVALKSDGTVTGWGNDDYGQTTSPAGVSNIVLVTAGYQFDVALLGYGPPRILNQLPPNLYLMTNDTAYLYSQATGLRPLNYQWLFKNSPLTGQTNNFLVLNNLATNNAGLYSLVVSNSMGTVISPPTMLNVVLPPGISSPPQSQTVILSNSVSFTVSVGGTAPLDCQWYFDGTALTDGGGVSGSATTNLVIDNVQTNEAGSYFAVITNLYGSVTSSPAMLTVLTPPQIATQPQSQTNAVSSNLVLSVSATGTAPLSYQWFFDGAPLSDGGRLTGSAMETLMISDAQIGDSGNYYVTITNAASAATSSVATVAVLIPPSITLQPTNQTVPQGSNVTFVAAVSGSAPLSVQWLFNGNTLSDGGQISGSATTNLTISNLQFGNSGIYTLLAANPVGSTTSAVASLTVSSPPILITGLTNQVTMIFSNVTFALSVTGSPPLYFQWQKNGTNLSDGGNIVGSSGPNLSISDPQLADSGQYSVTVSNAFGVLSNSAALTVVPVYVWGNPLTPPAAVTNAIGIGTTIYIVYYGENADFAVRADGSVVGWGNDFNSILDYTPPDNTNFVSLSDGSVNVIATRQDGTVATWGGNGTNVPSDVTNVAVTAIEGSEGAGAGLALQQNGSIVAWNIIAGGPSPPANATNIIALSAGAYGLGGCLAVSQNGTVIGWGDNTWGESSPPAQATNVVAVVCGDTHSIALRADGSVVTWGAGANTPPANATNVIAIAAGTQNDLVLRQDGTVVGWGGLGTAPSIITNVAAIAAEGNQNMVLVQNPNLAVPPRILQQPLGAVVQTNQTLILEGQITGSLPVQYQWYLNGTPLAGQNNRWLLLSPIQTTQGGDYQFVAANNFGSVTSSPAVVWTPPLITTPPAATVAFGSNAVFTLTVAGTTPLSYQWYYNGTPLSDGGAVIGSATVDLVVSNFQQSNLGNYTVVVTNLAGSATSGVATVTVLNPMISSQPQSQSALGGATVTFPVTATGGQPLTYQWQYNGTDLPGATNNPLILTNVLVSQSGVYSVVVSNAYGIAISSNATLTVTALSIYGQPQNQSVLGGATATFVVSVNGQQPIYCQWLFDGTALPNATNNPLVLTNVMVSQAGLYSVVLTNPYGMAISSNALLTVAPLAITVQPTNRVTWFNGPASFRVNVSGTPPFGFDWQCNGTVVPGIWTNLLTLTNVQMSQFGTYDVIVSNAYGSVVSSNALLSFSQVAVWGGTAGESNLTPGLTNIVAIAAGNEPETDCLALRSNGTAFHWPQTSKIAVTNQFLAIGGGGGQGPPFTVLEPNGIVAQWLVDDIIEPVIGLTNAVAIPAEEIYEPMALTTNSIEFGRGSLAAPAAASNILASAVAIAQGEEFALALISDDTVFAFGIDSAGQTNVPSGLSNVIAIAAGPETSFAVKSDGTVAAWGENIDGLITLALRLTNVIAIAANGNHALALMTNGTVAAWGDNTYGESSVPPGLTNVIAIAAGPTFSMALIGNGPPVSSAPLATPILGTNGFTLSIPSQFNRVYMLQYKNSVTGSNWYSLPLTPGNGGTLPLTDPSSNNPQRFYRVQRW